MLKLVTSAEQVIGNIHKYVASAGEFALLIPYARAWYAVRDQKSWQFGPSKFVGFENMTTQAYLGAPDTTPIRGRAARRPIEVDGRVTESVLDRWSELVEEGHPLYWELHQALNEFAARYSKKPNARAQISIVQIGSKAAAPVAADDLVALLAAVFRSLTPAQKAEFRKLAAS